MSNMLRGNSLKYCSYSLIGFLYCLPILIVWFPMGSLCNRIFIHCGNWSRYYHSLMNICTLMYCLAPAFDVGNPEIVLILQIMNVWFLSSALQVICLLPFPSQSISKAISHRECVYLLDSCKEIRKMKG